MENPRLSPSTPAAPSHPAPASDVGRALARPLPAILVIGANGGIGLQTVDQALAAGYHVRALVRNPANLTLTHPNLEIIKGDVLHPETYAAHLARVDAVISALGVRHNKPTTLYSQGNAILLQQMQLAGASRIFCISASGLDVNPTHSVIVRWLTKNVLQKILRNMYADLRLMEKLIKQSEVDWTIIRPPRLTNKPATGHHRIAIDQTLDKAYAIARADVAHFMLNNIFNPTTFGATVEIAL